MENNNAMVLNDWSVALAGPNYWTFVVECRLLLAHAETDPEWFLRAVDDLLCSLGESVPAWSPEERMLSAMFDTDESQRQEAHKELRVTRRALAIAHQRGDAMTVLAQLLLRAHALVQYRRTVRQWELDPWVEMATLHASEVVSNGSDVLADAVWIIEIAREYLEMERAGRRRAREAGGP